jgi:hypothetical protein
MAGLVPAISLFEAQCPLKRRTKGATAIPRGGKQNAAAVNCFMFDFGERTYG